MTVDYLCSKREVGNQAHSGTFLVHGSLVGQDCVARVHVEMGGRYTFCEGYQKVHHLEVQTEVCCSCCNMLASQSSDYHS